MKRTTIALAVLILAVPFVVVAVDTELRGNRIDDVVYLSDSTPISITSSTETPVPEMATTFNSRGRGLVLVTFCGETQVDGTLLVGIRLDGNLMPPGDVSLHEQFGSLSGISSHCHIYADEVGPGFHQVVAVWKHLGGPGVANMFFKSMRIDF